MSVINTNVSSLQAQNSLHKNETKLSTAMARLSSGIRINSAKDDAAGLAITTRMTSEVRGLTQAIRNANDGISVAQTAEGSLGEITNILQRLRELAVQSANSSNNSTDRSFLDTESKQLIAEVNRIGSQTNFNGIKLLDGSFTSQDFQVGANKGEVITFNSIGDSRATGLGSNTLLIDGSKTGSTILSANGAAVANSGITADATVTLSNANGGTANFAIAANTQASAIASAINTAANGIGITATASNSVSFGTFLDTGTVTFTINGAAISAAGSATDVTAVAAAINGTTSTTKITATIDPANKSLMTLTTSDGSDISIVDYANSGSGSSTAVFGTQTLTTGANGDSARQVGTISITSSKGPITVSDIANTEVFGSSTTATSSFTGVSQVDLSSQAQAANALSIVDAALTQVNNTRASLGGLINRFEATVSNQNTTITNLSASRSRILDTDYAVETTNLAKAQIIQQAATAMLAQANQSSQSVLALLK
jgi:flagellin